MLRRIMVVSVALLLVGAGQALAADDDDAEYGHIGGYAGIAGSYAINDGHGDLGLSMFDSGGVLVWVGYRIAPLASIDLQAEWQDGMKEINGFTLTSNLHWYPLSLFDLGSWAQPFISTGIGVISAKPEGNSNQVNGVFRLGGGLDVYLTDHWSVRLTSEWIRGTGRLSGVAYAPISLGAQYNW